jgi:3-deoxy-D-manno-octulosonic-acid transferase
MFFIYQVILSLLIVFSPIIFIFRFFKNKENKRSILEKICFSSKNRIIGKIIWFHGASVGEILSIVPILEKYEKDKSIKKILLTTSTLSSSKVIKKLKFKKIIHQFYPLDHTLFAKKFLNHWKPNFVIFIESEIWPAMFREINKKKIPLILLNARITKKTFKRWIKIKKFARSIFNNILISYPQNQETKFYLEKLGSKKIIKIGNLKFVENNFEKKISNSKSFKSIFQNKKVWVASSTHKDEEIFCAKAHIELKKQNKNLITIIIPRHVHRVKQIVKDIQNLGLSIAIHSSNNCNLKDKDIYIVDTFGETKKFHELASSVFLGGSIISRGGQNPLEAARSGARILHGPNIDNFKDVYKLLKFLKISIQIRNPKKLTSLILFKKDKYKALKIKKIGRKIFNKTVIEIDNLINNEFKKT